MDTEQHPQHQHAQWLASLATEHFVQQAIGSVAQDIADVQPDDSQEMEDEPQIVDMSGQTVVKLAPDPGIPPASSSPFNLRKKRKIERDEPTRHDEYKLIPSKDRNAAKNFDMRRPVRPIDRQKMRPWLKNLLDTGSVFGLNWLQREDGIFQISWRHASRLGWNLETDGDVFERWARHTGIFKDGDEPEPKRWKANFRCALHSLPDVKELTSPTDRKGRNASRTYRFLRPSEVQPPVKRKQRYNSQLPYGVLYQASEDSGSQHGDSDERNSDEEMFAEQVRAFPHCDHDYAIRSRQSDEEERTTEILSRHNSGYVLIKSKEANEYEFRLTPPESSSLPTSNKKTAPALKSSPQKKGKGSKKKLVNAAKKGKGKAGQKGAAALKKDGKPLRKIKKTSEKEASPATKVSLKTLLSGRKNAAAVAAAAAAAAKKPKVSPAALTASKGGKQAKGGKKARAKGKGKKEAGGGGEEASGVQAPGGLEALLEAASQIDRMAALPSAPVTVTSTRSTAGATSKRSSAPATTAPMGLPHLHRAPTISAPASSTAPVGMPLLQRAPIIYATPASLGQTVSHPGIAGPIVFAARHQLVRAPVPPGTTFIPITPVSAGIGPAPMPTQVSQTMLQKFLGLSAAANISPAQLTAAGSVGLDHAQSSDSQAEDKTNLMTIAAQADSSGKTASGLSDSPTLPLVMGQPESGMSMLKHLLRLTGPGMGATTTAAAAAAVPTSLYSVFPAAPQILAPVVTVQSASAVTSADTVSVKVEPSDNVSDANSNQADLEIYKTEYELAASQEGQWVEEDKGFPYIHVSTSKVYVKPEPSEAGEALSINNAVSDLSTVSVPQTVIHSDTTATQSTSFLPVAEGGAMVSLAPHVSLAQPGVDVQSAMHTSGSVPQVTLSLPPGLTLPQGHLASGSLAPTVTVTLPPQVSLPGAGGHGVQTATYTQSMDLMQFLNLCAASGNNQVIIKTEAPISSDLNVMSSTYSQEKAMAGPSQAGEEASTSSKFILVDTSLETSTTVGTGDGEGQETVLLDNSSLSAPSGSPALAEAVIDDGVPAAEDSLSTSVGEQAALATFMQAPQAEVSSASSVEVLPNQYQCIMNEADISSLSADQQGADSFVVDSML